MDDDKYFKNLRKLFVKAVARHDGTMCRVLATEAGILATTKERSNSAKYLGRKRRVVLPSTYDK